MKSGESQKYTYAGPRAKRLTAEQFTDAIWQITSTAPKKFDAPIQRIGSSTVKADALSARWIWSNDQKSKAADSGESVTFEKTIQLPAAPTRAAAAVTCDNSFKLSINGREIISDDNWQAPVGVNLQSALQAGKNTLTIVATNGGSGPNLAGLIFEARIFFADGTSQSIVTDASWTWADPTTKTSKNAVVLDGQVWDPTVQGPLQTALAEQLGGGGPMVRASLLKSDPFMRALGRPNREQIVSMRPNDLTTLEAMDLNNGQILTSRLADGADALLKSRPWKSSQELVTWLYAYAYSRPPTPEESAIAIQALGAKPTSSNLQDLLWAMLVQPEFQMVR